MSNSGQRGLMGRQDQNQKQINSRSTAEPDPCRSQLVGETLDLRYRKYRLANKFAPTIEMRSNRRSALARDGDGDGDVMVTRNEPGS